MMAYYMKADTNAYQSVSTSETNWGLYDYITPSETTLILQLL